MKMITHTQRAKMCFHWPGEMASTPSPSAASDPMCRARKRTEAASAAAAEAEGAA